MSFRSKIFLVLALVGLAPLLVIGWLSFSLNRAELEKTVGGAQAALAQEAARGAERSLARAIESLRLSVAILPVFELEPAERSAALLIPYRQLDFVGAVALVGADGTLLAEPAFGPRKPQGDTAALVTTKDVKRFLDHVPLRLALETGTAMSAPYSASGISRVAVALRIDGEKPVAVAAEVSLSELDHGMAGVAPGGPIAHPANPRGHARTPPPPRRTPPAASRLAACRTFLPGDDLSLVRPPPPAKTPVPGMVPRRDGNEWLASAFSVAGVGWTVVVAQPAEAAFRAAHRV